MPETISHSPDGQQAVLLADSDGQSAIDDEPNTPKLDGSNPVGNGENEASPTESPDEYDYHDDSLFGDIDYLFKDGELYSEAKDTNGNKTLVASGDMLSGEMLDQHRAAMGALEAGESTVQLEPIRAPFADTATQEAYSVQTYELLENGRVKISYTTKFVTPHVDMLAGGVESTPQEDNEPQNSATDGYANPAAQAPQTPLPPEKPTLTPANVPIVPIIPVVEQVAGRESLPQASPVVKTKLIGTLPGPEISSGDDESIDLSEDSPDARLDRPTSLLAPPDHDSAPTGLAAAPKSQLLEIPRTPSPGEVSSSTISQPSAYELDYKRRIESLTTKTEPLPTPQVSKTNHSETTTYVTGLKATSPDAAAIAHTSPNERTYQETVDRLSSPSLGPQEVAPGLSYNVRPATPTPPGGGPGITRIETVPALTATETQPRPASEPAGTFLAEPATPGTGPGVSTETTTKPRVVADKTGEIITHPAIELPATISAHELTVPPSGETVSLPSVRETALLEHIDSRQLNRDPQEAINAADTEPAKLNIASVLTPVPPERTFEADILAAIEPLSPPAEVEITLPVLDVGSVIEQIALPIAEAAPATLEASGSAPDTQLPAKLIEPIAAVSAAAEGTMSTPAEVHAPWSSQISQVPT